MKYIFSLRATCIALFLLVSQAGFPQVAMNINSGNPAFPFPQFLDYGANRKSLASENAPGVTHAEMEQRCRDAWQMICNNVAKYDGVIVGGVQYIFPDTLAPISHCRCVEGDGYYLLGAAIMADKAFFDGYYMWAHDRAFQGTQRFVDGVVTTPNYGYSKGLSGAGMLGSKLEVHGSVSNNSATDGDVDLALALLMAYKQWGEHSGIFIPSMGGKELNYKEEALKYIRAMVDTAIFPLALPMIKYTSGDVGFDGYLKGGDSQGELTEWASGGYLGMARQVGQQNYYYDYSAPAWFRQFRLLLESENDNAFFISQYKRVEASCDWLMGLHYSKNVKNIPYLGKVLYKGSDTDFDFDNYIPDGEDFRASWRTIMNYVWHDNPTYTWNPVTHQVDNSPNTYERDMGLRYAKFLKEPQSSPWNNPCRNIGDLNDGARAANQRLTFKGPYTLMNGYKPDGTVLGSFPLNWIHGTGAASAIVGQDFGLMGEMFRHCCIAWDGAGYLNAEPTYFHEWFKMLGLLTLSGNFHAPDKMIAQPNLKVYHKIDKTYAFTGDQVTYTVSYRNYGSVDASGSVVKFGIPAGFEFVSSTKGTLVGDSVVWNVGTIKGFKTGGLAATQDSMKIVLKIGPSMSGRYCTTARVFCTNGLGWTSNEYPNNQTAVMERNCIDVVKRALRISKSSDREKYNPGQDIRYKIVFENSSDVGWMNGGRPGVRVAFAHNAVATPSAAKEMVMKFRLYNDASEPYIDYGNYRISYFMNDPSLKCLSGTAGCTTGWGLVNQLYEGGDPTKVKDTVEAIVPGSDANGSWNQRLVVQFSNQLATITQHLQQYANGTAMIHEGGTMALKAEWRMFNYSASLNWTDDWSWDATKSEDDNGGLRFPISDDYSDPDNLGLPIDGWHKSGCQTTTNIMRKVLVEEWDGYTWRRILGNGPSPGRDIDNVVVTDTLPAGITFKNFIKQTALGISATTTVVGGRTVITWTIPKMQVNMKDSILFTATVGGTCPFSDTHLTNNAWIQGRTESAVVVKDTVLLTCIPEAICPDATTFTKTSDKTTYSVGQTVKYSMSYTQTQGSIANPDLGLSTDWTAQLGAMTNATFGSGKVSVGQVSSGDFVMTHDYSYGTNTLGDGIEGTIQITSYAKAAIALRHTGGALTNGIYIVIKPAYITEFAVYNGTTLLGSGTIPYNSPSSLDFRIKLTGDKLDLWLAPTPAAFSGAAVYTLTGLPVRAGWFGVARGNTFGDPSGTGDLTSWKTHLDAAFNVTITDPVPTGIITPTAITTSVGSGANVSSVITYTLVSGKTPMLYNATATLSWNGIYNACQKITNIAYVNALGLTTNQYGICYEINCGTACTPPTSVTLTASPASGTACSGGSGVTLTASALPSTTAWKYEFSKGGVSLGTASTTATYTATATGSYTVTAYNPADATCKLTSSAVAVTINPLPVVSVSANDSAICAGSLATLAASGATSYSWDNALGTSASVNVSPATTTTYTVTGTTGACTGTASLKITVNALPVVTATPTPAYICEGGSTTLSATVATGTATYAWSNSLGNTATVTAAPTTNTTYTVTGTAGTGTNACSSTAQVAVSVNPKITVNISADDSSICTGGGATLAAGGATTYAWSNSLGNTATVTAAPPTTTTYTVTGTTGSGTGVCTGTASLAITVNTPPTITASASPASVCAGGSTTVTAAGGTSYKWDNGATTASITATPTGNTSYKVTGTDGNGCTGTGTASVTHAAPVAPAVRDTTVTIGAVAPTIPVISPDAAYTYKWYDAAGTALLHTGTTYPTGISTASAGVFTFMVSGTLNGCEGAKVKFTVTVSGCTTPAPTVNYPAVDTCQGKPFRTVTASGITGASFTWYDATGSGTALATTASFTPPAAGTYKVSQTSLCEGPRATVVATGNPLPTVTLTTPDNSLCEGTKLELYGGGAISYRITQPSIILIPAVFPHEVPSPASGTYTIEGTDARGCVNTASVSITVNQRPSVTITRSADELCPGGSSTLTAGGSDSYTWSDGSTLATRAVTPPVTTAYMVTGTSAAGCTSTSPATATITVHQSPTIKIQPNRTAVCQGDTTLLVASGASTYSWSTGGAGDKIIVSPLQPSGTYTVTGTDTYNCTATATTTVVVNNLPVVTITPQNTQVCLGTSTTLTAGGADSYKWDDNSTTATRDVTPAVPTTYNVTGTDAKGCSSQAGTTVDTLQLPRATLGGGGSYCTTRPAITLAPAGGKAGYKVTYTTDGANPYTMTSVTGNTTLPVTADGTYAITGIEDANGCKATSLPAPVSVSKNGTATYTIGGGGTYCQGQARNPVVINITSNDGPWTMEYNDGSILHTIPVTAADLPYNIANPAAGTYTVTQVTNKDNCTAAGDATRLATVVINDTTLAAITGLPATLCANAKPLTLGVTPAPGTGETATITGTLGTTTGYTYRPDMRTGTETLLLTYTNAAGCTSRAYINTNLVGKPAASIAGAPGYGVCLGSSQLVDATATGGTAGYTHEWFQVVGGAATSLVATEDYTLPASATRGSYELRYIATDANACKDTASITMEVKPRTRPRWLTSLPSPCTGGGTTIDLKDFVTPYDATGGSFTLDGKTVTDTIIDPAVTGAKAISIKYTYTMGQCSESEDTTLTIKASPTIDPGNYQSEFCEDATSYNFSTISPQAGSLSGTGANGLTFNPSLATTKDSPFDLTYTVTQDGCTSSKVLPVTVWRKPVVSFNLPATACARDAAIDLAATPAGGTFSLADGLSAAGVFSPRALQASSYNNAINITYTATSHGCSTTVAKSITVNKTDVPKVRDTSAIAPVTTVPPVTATGTSLKLYNSSYGLIDGNWNGTYADQANTAVGEYTYHVTQTLDGCESDSVPVKLTITSCTAGTPGGIGSSVCQGTAPGTLTATGLSQAGMEYRWFENNVYTGTAGDTMAMATGLAPGRYPYTVKIYDPAGDCYGPASQPVVYEVKKLPAMNFAPDTVVCENDNAQVLSTKTSLAGATFWLGGTTQVTSFDPSANIGINKVEIRYTDPTTSCRDSLTGTIRVKAKPAITFALPATACTSSPAMALGATPPGGTYSGAPVVNTSSFMPRDLQVNVPTTYTYKFTDPATNCSNTAQSTVTVRDTTTVKITAPADRTTLCKGGPAIRLATTATAGSTITWGEFSGTGVTAAGDFTPATDGSFTIAYRDTNASGCASVSKLTITVAPLPVVSVPLQAITACSNGNPVALAGQVNGVDATLDFTGNSVTETGLSHAFDPRTAPTGANTITYSYTDANQCGNTGTMTITVQQVLPPAVADQEFYTFTDPKTVTATSGDNMKWYGDKTDKSDLLATAQQLTSGDLVAKAYKTDLATPGTFVFHADQTQGSCTSDLAAFNVVVNPCPALPPTLASTAASSCSGAALETFTVTGHPMGDQTSWYDASKKFITTGATFTPGIANAVTGTTSYTFYAADTLNIGCRGPLVPVTYTIKFVAQPTISVPATHPCARSVTGSLTAAPAGGIFRWTTPAGTFTVNPLPLALAGITAGSATAYTVTAVKEEDGCTSAATTASVYVDPVPAKPAVTVTPAWVCDGQAMPAVSATAAGTITWRDASMGFLATGSPALPATALSASTARTTGWHYFHATQTAGSCESDTATAAYEVRGLPLAPITRDTARCAGNPMPQLTATPVDAGATIAWYTDAALTLGKTGSRTYTPAASGTDYYAVAVLRGCQGTSFTSARVIDDIAPAPVIAGQDSICPGGAAILQAATTGTATWYDGDKNYLEQAPGHVYSGYSPATFLATAVVETAHQLRCTSGFSAPFTVSIHTAPVVSISPPDTVTCAGDQVTLAASGASTYTWGNSETTASVTGSTAGQYWVTGTDARGCTGTAKATVSVNPRPTASAWATPDTLCHGASTTLDASGGTLFAWGGNTPSTNPAINVRPARDTTFSVVVTNDDNCGATAVVAVVVLPRVPVPSLLSDHTCQGAGKPSLEVASGEVTWLDAAGNPSSRGRLEASITAPGTYAFKAAAYLATGSRTCHGDTVDLAYSVLPAPVPLISGPDSLCEGTVGAAYSASPDTNSYSWSATGGVTNYRIDDRESFRRRFDWIAPGIDTVTVSATSPGGCPGVASLVVRVAPRPVPFFTEEPAGREGVAAFYNLSTQEPVTDGAYSDPVANHFDWFFGRAGDTLERIDSATGYSSPIERAFPYGYHRVTLTATSDFGCSETYAAEIYVDISTGLFTPNAICPSCPAGELHGFRPRGFNLQEYRVWVYDTWGNLIWYSDKLVNGEPAESWDGSCNGVPLRTGSYVWKIDATFRDGKKWTGDGTAPSTRGKAPFGNIIIIR